MIKEAIGVGDNELEALKDAKKQLGLDEDADVEFELIQRAEKKKFGLFGGQPAKVKVVIAEEDEPEEQVEEEVQQKDEKVDFGAAEDKAETFLRSVLDCMNLGDITVEKKSSDGGVEFDLEGEEVGFVIGRRGETLDALQYITSLVANHGDDNYLKVTINTGNYREKREKTLEILGRKLAFKAIKTGRKTSLEPMNPYERRIIHTAVQKVNGATSWSEGENANRHVVIGPDPKAKNFRRGGGYNRGKGSGRRQYNSRPGGAKPTVNPDRVPLNEGGETGGLYGRIDK